MSEISPQISDLVDGARRDDVRQLLRTIDAVEASDGDDAADYIGGLLHGFQIWLNLPSAEKNAACGLPEYS